ncbi:DUF1772 domain-containing protein [Salinispora oceanensis]|uniref:DUF1772 domain-containing protein n=1 Tax=Salinispora oceanensis TaxID=1050199 RepID=UPI0003675FF8|nr:DUF1772 domain-containing protein [Salinispora oceanensis]
MVRVLLPLALVFSGFAAGGLMISSLGGAPLLLALPTERYIPVHQFLVTRFDPFMPISMTVTLALDLALTLIGPSPAFRLLTTLAAALLAIAMMVSLTKNVPINRWISTLDPEQLPDDWQRLDPRVRWRNWNLVRTVLAVTALLLNTSAVAVLL